jgi:Sulfotransferase family
MTDVVCHIGLHKTATTTLQRQFFPACKDLNLLLTKDPVVRDFIYAVRGKDPLFFDAHKAREQIYTRIVSDRVNVLSNESLSGPPYAGVVEWGLDHRSPVLANLRSVFPDARAVIVLRRQDALAKSLYRQYVKRGGTRRIRQFYGLNGTGLAALMSTDRFLFSPYLHLVRESFPAGVLVLTFEQFVQDQEAFLQRLCTFLRISRPAVKLHAENATRLGAFGMEATRIMNFFFRSMLNQGVLPGIPVRRDGGWHQVSIVEYIHQYWPGRADTRKDSELNKTGAEILAMFREDNARLDQQWSLGLREFGYY